MLTTLVHQHLRIARRALRLFALAAITAAVFSCSGAATNRPKQHPFLSMQQHPTLDDKTGIIQGIVGDERTGDRLAGATIIAKLPGSPHQEAIITDDNGEFVLQHLTPGAYNLDIYYADLEQHESHVTVGAGEITLRWLWFDTSTVRPESVTLVTAALATRKGNIDRTHGAVNGVVKDMASDAPIPEVTVVVAYDAQRQSDAPARLDAISHFVIPEAERAPPDAAPTTLSRVVFTDEEGRFAIGELPPGPYLLTFYYDRATAQYPVDIVANTWQPAPTAFATAPRVLPEYFARWRTPRIKALEPLSSYHGVGIQNHETVEWVSGHNFHISYPTTFVDDISFSANCMLGERPCAPTIARTDYPAFGTSSIWRFNPFAGLHQR